MKKKNLLIYVTSLVLVAALSVGGTLAYLSATSNEVTNTFTASADIAIKLDEAKVDPKTGLETTGSRDLTNDYKDIYPSKTVDKDPTVTIITGVTGGEYVYISLEGTDAIRTVGALNADGNYVKGIDTDKWTLVASDDDGSQDGVYRYNKVVDVTDGTMMDDALFYNVNFDASATLEQLEAYENEDIVLKAYAIQYAGVSQAEADKAATDVLWPSTDATV